MSVSSVREVNELSFEEVVLKRSYELPVVVDFWAPWCGPCRMLGPVLESLVEAQGGSVELAKLNTDENPNLSYQYKIESIPAVKAFKDGQVVSEFIGALPEVQVRSFVERLLPTEADQLAEAAARQAYAGNPAAAEESYRQALRLDPGHRAASIGLARLLAARDATADAVQLLDRLPGDAEAVRIRAQLRFALADGDADAPELAQRLAADPKDVDARYRLAMVQAASGDFEAALENLLEVVKRDRAYGEDAGRRSMLDVFSVLGDDDPLTQTYRRQLGYLLF